MQARPRSTPWRLLWLLPLALLAPTASNTGSGRFLTATGAAAQDEKAASPSNWLHWRGPLQTGFAADTNLPDDWDPRVPGQGNLVWKQPYGCRSTPLIMNGLCYIIGADNEPLGVPTLKEKHLIGERVTCFDAKTGEKQWEQSFNVFHTDIVANRLGWSPLAGDPETKRLYAHTTGGFLFCFDSQTGKIIWQRQMTEEFGRISGYGGRIGSGPTLDSGLVIVGIDNGSWGNYAIGTNRLYAFDARDGRVIWISEAPNPFHNNTYNSNPIIAVINGERQLITGGADGALTAYQVRTGKVIWTYVCSSGVVNPSPVADGNLVYIAHGEENPEGGDIGRMVCVDASQVVKGRPKLVWEFKKGVRFGLSSPAIAGGYVYMPDDAGKLYCFDAKKGGNPKWKYNYGKTARGAPVVADGKIYISETNARFCIIKLKEDGSEPDEDATHIVEFKKKQGAEGFVESNCTPSVSDGKVYLGNRDELFCIGKKGTAKRTELPKAAVETPAGANDPIASLQLVPAEITLAPGATAEFELRAYNARGQLLKDAKIDVKWTLPLPNPPKGATYQPPPLDAALDAATGKITVNPKKASQIGYVEASTGTIASRVRVRVAPQIPYQQDFEALPVTGSPPGWINTQGKYRVVELKEADGTMSKVLSKVNTNPRRPVARALGYITTTTATDYTIEADLKGVAVRGKLPDIGVCANRYILILDGRTDEGGNRHVRITTWEALPTPLPAGRVAVEENLTWKDNTWYRVKLSVEVGEKVAMIRGKVWERGQKEPENWTMQMTDPRPNREGAAALYGYISNATDVLPGSEAYYDNVVITPHKK